MAFSFIFEIRISDVGLGLGSRRLEALKLTYDGATSVEEFWVPGTQEAPAREI